MGKRRKKPMNLTIPNSIRRNDSEKSTGWRRLKQIAEKAMDNGNFTVNDVKEDLNKLRATYKD